MTATAQLPRNLDIWQKHHTGPIPPQAVRQWVSHMAALCLPERIYWCNGSAEERDELAKIASKCGNGSCCSKSCKGSFAEQRNFICANYPDPAWPADSFMERNVADEKVHTLFKGCMKRRTMYVVPFVIGPLASRASGIGVQLTDSADVVLAMRKTICIGDAAWKLFSSAHAFTRLLHATGGNNHQQPCVFHFPDDNTVWSFTA